MRCDFNECDVSRNLPLALENVYNKDNLFSTKGLEIWRLSKDLKQNLKTKKAWKEREKNNIQDHIKEQRSEYHELQSRQKLKRS